MYFSVKLNDINCIRLSGSECVNNHYGGVNGVIIIYDKAGKLVVPTDAETQSEESMQ